MEGYDYRATETKFRKNKFNITEKKALSNEKSGFVISCPNFEKYLNIGKESI